jgi:anthranilate phosphoribosyltransferase
MDFHGNLLVLRNSRSSQYNMPLLSHLERLVAGHNLSAEEAQSAMQTILDGKASPAQIAGFLMALRVQGETVDELVGFARAMRQTAVRVELNLPGETLLDTCGAGGDGAGTFNISTVAAFVVAGAGVRVAKHGNRAVTSQSGCGSADLLDSFGIAIDASPERAAQAIREVGIGFFYAPAIHKAMRHAAPVRADLKIRTAFNLLGPLTNPAGANAQLVGAPSEREAQLLAGALAALGLPRGFVVHGLDGLDEITTTGATLVFEIRNGGVENARAGRFRPSYSDSRAVEGRWQRAEFGNRPGGAAWRARRNPRYRDRQRGGGAGGGGAGGNFPRRRGDRGRIHR